LTRFLLVCALAFALCAPAARADGDPASDILPSEDVYYGYAIDLRSKEAAQLPAMLATSRARGYELKVALLSGFQDLGIATWMWLDPREYARYLGAELSLVYHGHLLVLMRNGYGVYFDGKVPGVERRVISRLPPPRRAANFLESAIDATRALAAANGVKLTVPDVKPPPGGVKMGASHTTPGAAGAGAAGTVATPAPGAPATAGEPTTGAPAPSLAAPPGRGSTPAWPFLAPIALVALAAAIAIVRSRRTAARLPRE
jgi:hypothetical protein